MYGLKALSVLALSSMAMALPQGIPSPTYKLGPAQSFTAAAGSLTTGTPAHSLLAAARPITNEVAHQVRGLLDPADLVSILNNLTSQSTNLLSVGLSAGSNGLNLDLDLLRRDIDGDALTSGLQSILGTVETTVSGLTGLSAINDTGVQQEICTAVHQFSIAHGKLLNGLSEGSGLLGSVLNLVSNLVSDLEDVVGELLDTIVTIVPVCSAEAKTDSEDLGTILGNTVHALTSLL
ncbi:hypothetical protein BDV97DRAFT_401824 [Delphinella strobiligena]|nr:hypothetical protein BDV97DRAFT_401824 [Delphinella strobiligena]